MFARYIYYVDHALSAAFLWAPGSGIVHANTRGRAWTSDLVQAEILNAAAAQCVATQRADLVNAAGAAFLLLPLMEARDRSRYVFGIEGYDVADTPRLLHDLYETPRHFSNVVHSLPQIVLTAQPNGDFDYASNQWYKASGCKLFEANVGEMLRAKLWDPPEFLRRWGEGVEGGFAFGFEFRLHVKSGVRWYELQAVPSYDQGRLRKWIVSLNDIDELVHNRELLAGARRRLEALSAIGTLALNRDVSDEELLRKALACASRALDALWLFSFVTEDVKLVAYPNDARLFARVFSEEPHAVATTLTSQTWNGEAARPVVRVPLHLDGEPQPGLAVIGAPGAAPFDELDQHFAREVAWRIEHALGNLIKTRREARIATVLQTALLPVSLPQANGLSFDVAYRSADFETLVGGDWYDGFRLPDGRIAFSIGDVGGHGLNAAFIMGHVREMVRTAAMRGLAPHEVFATTNEAVLASGYGLISAFLGYIDPLTLELQFAVAGHPVPLLVSGGGHVEALAGGGDEILGATHAAHYRGNALSLEESAALVLYTDGVTEHSRDVDAGEAALIAALAAWARGGFDAYALEILTNLLAGKPVRDDAALLVLRAQPITRLDETMPADPASSGRARRAVRRALKHSELGLRSEEFVLAICEAVNNAIEHGSPRPGDRVHVLVECDGAEAHALVESAGPWRDGVQAIERGRGLLLMRAICDRVVVDVHDPGTTVDLHMALATGRERVGTLQA